MNRTFVAFVMNLLTKLGKKLQRTFLSTFSHAHQVNQAMPLGNVVQMGIGSIFLTFPTVQKLTLIKSKKTWPKMILYPV